MFSGRRYNLGNHHFKCIELPAAISLEKMPATRTDRTEISIRHAVDEPNRGRRAICASDSRRLGVARREMPVRVRERWERAAPGIIPACQSHSIAAAVPRGSKRCPA
jgi:hypothetical protein